MGIVLEFKKPGTPARKKTDRELWEDQVKAEAAKPKLPNATVAHLMTQDDQPYGSVRRCCESCGRMMVGTGLQYTDERFIWANLPPAYVRCVDVEKEFR